MQAQDLLRQLKRTVDELAVLNEIGKALTSSLDVGEVMHVILAKVSELLRPRNWSLLLRDPQTGELYFKTAVGAGSEMLLHLRLRKGEGIAGWVAENNKPLLVPDVHADPRFAARFDKTSRFQTKAILCVPLAFKGRVLASSSSSTARATAPSTRKPSASSRRWRSSAPSPSRTRRTSRRCRS